MRSISNSGLLAAATLAGSLLYWPAQGWADTLPATVFGSRAPVSAEVLAGERGGAGVQVRNENWVDGMVHDNQANNVQTGNNQIGGGSFAGAAGFVVAVQNSGNNVLVQNATIVNVQVR